MEPIPTMNKRGFIWSMSTMILIVLLLITSMILITNDTMRETGREPVKLNLVWKDLTLSNSETQTVLGQTVVEFVYSIVNLAGYWLFRGANMLSDWAAVHPELDGKTLYILVALFLISPLIWPLFKISVALVLIIKEYFVNRAEKKGF